MPRRPSNQVLAAIDVGTNAVRLEIVRQLPDQTFEVLHQERDAVRPGEGVFATGSLPRETADRLIATLRRYGALCRRFRASVRAVATSALREAKNRDAIVERVRREAGLELEVISGREEARLICLGVLHGRPANARSLVIDIGGGSTEVIDAQGDRPRQLWSVGVGAVRLTEIFDASGKVSSDKLRLMRRFAEEAFREGLPKSKALPRVVLGSSGTIQAVLKFAAPGEEAASLGQVRKAVERVADMRPDERREQFDPKRAEIIVAGAVVLEAVMQHLRIKSIAAVDRGLRDGVLVDLSTRGGGSPGGLSMEDEVVSIGRRFQFAESHALQVSRLSLQLFDDLARLHELPAATRPILEAAALLHDVGHTVSHRNHHKHSAYLVQNAELPGLSDHERELCALVARFHRRSAPERSHPALASLSTSDFRLVRRLATLVRVADSLDRSHQQVVRAIRVQELPNRVLMKVRARSAADLELWDLEHEADLFKRVFGKKLEPSLGR